MSLRNAIGFFGVSAPGPAILYDGNTVAWYIADDLSTITKDGANLVSRWNDKLASGHDLIQLVGINQPLWVSPDSILFDGVNDYLKTAAFVYDQPAMVYMIFRQITWTLNDYIFDGNTDISMQLRQSALTPNMRPRVNATTLAGTGSALGVYQIIRVLYNGATSKFILNGGVPVAGALDNVSPGGFVLGTKATAGTGYSNVQVKEIILRKIADTAANEVIIYNYYAVKYGFPTI